MVLDFNLNDLKSSVESVGLGSRFLFIYFLTTKKTKKKEFFFFGQFEFQAGGGGEGG